MEHETYLLCVCQTVDNLAEGRVYAVVIEVGFGVWREVDVYGRNLFSGFDLDLDRDLGDGLRLWYGHGLSQALSTSTSTSTSTCCCATPIFHAHMPRLHPNR
jgi:hypothetical protein